MAASYAMLLWIYVGMTFVGGMGAQDLGLRVLRDVDDPAHGAGIYTSQTQTSLAFHLLSTAPESQLQLMTSRYDAPARTSFRILLQSESRTEERNALFNYYGLDHPIMTNPTVGKYNDTTATEYHVSWEDELTVSTIEGDTAPVFLRASVDAQLDYINLELGRDLPSNAYTQWTIPPAAGMSFWLKPGLAGEYRHWVDVPMATKSEFTFYARSCFGARVAVYTGEGSILAFEIIFGVNDSPVIVVHDDKGTKLGDSSSSKAQTPLSCFDFRSFTVMWDSVGYSLYTPVDTGPTLLLTWPGNNMQVAAFGFTRGEGDLNEADFFVGNIEDLAPTLIGEDVNTPSYTDSSVVVADMDVAYIYPILSKTRLTVITQNHKVPLTLAVATSTEIKVKVSLGVDHEATFTLQPEASSVEFNGQVINAPSIFSRANQLTVCILIFQDDDTLMLMPVDGSTALVANLGLLPDAGPATVLVNPSEADPTTRIQMDQIAAHEIRFDTAAGVAAADMITTSLFLVDHVILRVDTSASVTLTLCRQVEACHYNELFVLTLQTDQTALLRDASSDVEVQGASGATLQEGTFVTFWLRWNSGLAVGRGTDIHRNEFLRLNANARSVWAMGFQSAGSASWAIVKNAHGMYLDSSVSTSVDIHKPINSFQVTTMCNDFKLDLTNRPLHNVEESIPVSVTNWGAAEGQCNVQRSGSEDYSASLALRHASGILGTRRLWISFWDDAMFVGQGPPMGLTAMRTNDEAGGPASLEKALIVFAGKHQKCSPAWTLPMHGGGKSVGVSTIPGAALDWLTVTDDISKVFTVASCTPVQLVLSEWRGLLGDSDFTVTFDGVSEGQVTIHSGYGNTGDPEDSGQLGAFDCGVDRWLWISWQAGTIQAGVGEYVGRNPLVTHTPAAGTLKVGALGFHQTGSDALPATWTFPEEQVSVFDVITFGDGAHKPNVVIFHDVFSFRLRTCAEARLRIGRSRNAESSETYLFILNPKYGNHSGVKEGTERSGQFLSRADLGGKISCTEYTDFWIAYTSTSVQLGQGDKGRPPLLELTGVDGPQNYRLVQLDSTGVAHWAYTDTAAMVSQFTTPRDSRYDRIMYQKREGSSLRMRVMTGGDISLGLFGPSYGNRGYFIKMSEEDSGISTVLGSQPESTINDEFYFPEDEMQSLWVSWADEAVSVGFGREVGQFPKLFLDAHVDPMVFALGMAGLPSSRSSNVLWEFSDVPDGAFIYKTSGEPSRDRRVLLPVTLLSYTMRLRSCTVGYVNLYTEVEGSTSVLFTIELGPESSILTANNVVTDTYDGGLTSCEEDVEVTLSWDQVFAVHRTTPSGDKVEVLNGGKVTKPIRELAVGSKLQNGEVTAYWTLWPVEGKSLMYTAAEDTDEYCCLWKMVTYEDAIILNVREIFLSGQKHAKVILSALPGVISDDVYELDLTNSYSQLRLNGQSIVDFPTPSILSNSRDYTFWIRWKTPTPGLIQVGSGAFVGQGQFMSYFNPAPFEINALAVNSHTTWRFDLMPEPMFQAHTPTGLGDREGVLLWMVREDFFFKVQGSDDTHLLLLGPNEPEVGLAKIILGAVGDANLLIRDPVEGTVIANATVPNLLSEDMFTSFELQFSESLLTVSFNNGKTTDTSIELLSTPIRAGVIDRILLFSPWRSQESPYMATWQWSTDQAVGVQYPLYLHEKNTRAMYQWRDVLETTYVFQVKGCADVVIALASEKLPEGALPGAIDATDIILKRGAAELSCDSAYACLEIEATEKLECASYQTYWLSWKEDFSNVTAGLGGTPWEGVLGSVAPTTRHVVKAVGLRNPTTTPMDFRVLNTTGNAVKAVTSEYSPGVPMTYQTVGEKQYWDIMGTHTLTLAFWASLNDIRSTLASATYRFSMDQTPNVTALTLLISGEVSPVENYQSAGLLNVDQAHKFWTTWSGGTFRFGTLSAGGQEHELMDYKDPNYSRVQVVTMATPKGYGHWDVTQKPGDTVMFNVNGEVYMHNDAYVTVSGLYRFDFEVKSGQQVRVALMEIPGIRTTDTYEIVIDTDTVTLRPRVGGGMVDTENSADLLNSENFVQYWVSYGKQAGGDTHFRFGRRAANVDARIIYYKAFTLSAINAISLKTLPNALATWKYLTPSEYPIVTTSSTARPTTPTLPGTTSPEPPSTVTKAPPPPPTTATPDISTVETTANDTDTASQNSGGGVSAGTIVGIVIVLIIVILLIAGAIYYKDVWMAWIKPDPDLKHLVQYNAKDEDDSPVNIESSDPHLSFEGMA